MSDNWVDTIEKYKMVTLTGNPVGQNMLDLINALKQYPIWEVFEIVTSHHDLLLYTENRDNCVWARYVKKDIFEGGLCDSLIEFTLSEVDEKLYPLLQKLYDESTKDEE